MTLARTHVHKEPFDSPTRRMHLQRKLVFLQKYRVKNDLITIIPKRSFISI